MEASAVSARRVAARVPLPERLAVVRAAERRLTPALTAAHLIGAVDVFLLLFFVLPTPDHAAGHERITENLIAAAIYLPLATAVGIYLGRRSAPSRLAWMREGREPDPEERASLLALPLRCVAVDAGLWLGAAVLFSALNVAVSADLAFHVGMTIAMGGMTTCAVCYLLVERLIRPVTAIALASGPPARPAKPGVEARLVLGWLLATGVPLLGLLFVGIHGLKGEGDPEAITRSVLVLATAAFAIGLVVTVVVARSVSQPLAAVRRAQARVQGGDLHAAVRVDDGSEVGLLQSGFNRMVEGLRERDRMQDLFSRHVGEDVARAALEADPELGGGEVREVAVLFVDLVGSTELAMRSTPHDVVARLNRFFAIVVETTAAHGGWVNKFEGDAALCVFGAPGDQPEPAACALAAARELDQRLRAELGDMSAGIGLSAGPAVAGWVGAERRFEYTVIGDPVNQAARLCELAKRTERRVLASDAILERAGDEARRWRLGDTVQLRGRSRPTQVAVPA